jgi:hypothetical protein
MSTVVAVVAVAIAIAFIRVVAWDCVGATTGALMIVALFWWGLARPLYWMSKGR